jgi:alanine-synthesizing transaminase
MNWNFYTIDRLPPYVFAEVNEAKMKARKEGEDIIDLGMGNPDIPTPEPIVQKVCEAVQNPRNHRYSASRGITGLRNAIVEHYKRNYDVPLDPETEAIATIGVKEGLAHLALAIISPGDKVLVPCPTYPIHAYSVIIARGDLHSVPLFNAEQFLRDLTRSYWEVWPKPKILIVSFPHNPTTIDVSPEFFIELVKFATKNNLIVIHDFAYADLAFDGFKPTSFLQVPGAKEIGVEFYSMSKSFSMPGWRVGFCLGNAKIIHALTRVKSYLDYGIFQPVQIASVLALRECQDEIANIVNTYQSRRDCLISGLERVGWKINPPRSTMFVWAEMPEKFKHMGSLAFSKYLIEKAKVAVSPGIGFGALGENYVRFALVENEQRIRQAVRGIKKALE